MKIFKLIIIVAFNVSIAFGQEWQLIRTVQQKNINQLSVDQVGFIYTTDAKGVVKKYSSDGSFLVEYAPIQVADIHETVALSQFKILLFYKDLQEVVILNRYLANPVRYRLSDYNLGYVEEVAPTFQPTIWIVDISDFSLKLIDFNNKRILERKSLAQVFDQNVADILAFHYHQNRMYVVDGSSGIHVFDNIGNYMTKLSSDAPSDIGFDKDYLYFEKNGILKFVHLYQGENMALPLEDIKFEKLKFVNKRLITITSDGFNIYK